MLAYVRYSHNGEGSTVLPVRMGIMNRGLRDLVRAALADEELRLVTSEDGTQHLDVLGETVAEEGTLMVAALRDHRGLFNLVPGGSYWKVVELNYEGFAEAVEAGVVTAEYAGSTFSSTELLLTLDEYSPRTAGTRVMFSYAMHQGICRLEAVRGKLFTYRVVKA